MRTTSLAICLGVAVTTVLSPGTGIALPVASGSLEAGKAPGMGDFLFNLVPDNVFAALAEGRVIQLIVFALLLGVAAVFAPTDIRLAFHRGASVIDVRSEEHTSELQSLMRISYAVFCLTKNNKHTQHH